MLSEQPMKRKESGIEPRSVTYGKSVCDSGEVGDKFHHLLNCSNANVKRNHTKYFDKYYTHHPNVPKFCSLMNMTSKSKNVKLAKFISCIFELF